MAAASTYRRFESNPLFNMHACNLSGASFVLGPNLYNAQRLAHPLLTFRKISACAM